MEAIEAMRGSREVSEVVEAGVGLVSAEVEAGAGLMHSVQRRCGPFPSWLREKAERGSAREQLAQVT